MPYEENLHKLIVVAFDYEDDSTPQQFFDRYVEHSLHCELETYYSDSDYGIPFAWSNHVCNLGKYVDVWGLDDLSKDDRWNTVGEYDISLYWDFKENKEYLFFIDKGNDNV